MANTNKPFGLRLVGKLGGDIGTVHIRRFTLPAAEGTATFLGDTVIMDVETSVESAGVASPNLNQVDGTPYAKINSGADNAVLTGVIVGFAFDPTDLTNNYRKATTRRDVFVCDDPLAIFVVQTDGSGCTANNVNMNCTVATVAGDTTTGVSKSVAGGFAADASLPFLCLGFVRDPSNDITSAAYVRVLVKINNHSYANAALGI
jgi:hypothetical protein